MARYLLAFMELIEQPRFRLASEALTTHHLQHSDRMMAAHVWTGIEALVEIRTELRFRLSAIIAATLEPPGPQRHQLFKRIQKLYDVRSKIVHGAKIDEKEIRSHTIQAREILARLMRRFVEVGSLPTSEGLEAALFSAPPFGASDDGNVVEVEPQ